MQRVRRMYLVWPGVRPSADWTLRVASGELSTPSVATAATAAPAAKRRSVTVVQPRLDMLLSRRRVVVSSMTA